MQNDEQFEKRYMPYGRYLKPYGRKLRKNMTAVERKLWYCFLRTYSVRVMRQHPMLDYIVDFYCAKARLVIELDGMHHGMGEQKQRDIIRDERLESLGCTVLRIANHHVEFDFTAVCRQIDSTIQTLIVSRKPPPCQGGCPSVRE